MPTNTARPSVACVESVLMASVTASPDGLVRIAPPSSAPSVSMDIVTTELAPASQDSRVRVAPSVTARICAAVTDRAFRADATVVSDIEVLLARLKFA